MLHATTRSRRLLRRDDAHPRHARSSRRLCLETLESRRLLTHVSGFHFPAAIVDGESGSPMVELRLEATDLAGAPITQTPAGSEFYLSAWVRDARAGVETAGVYAAYFDLAYDQQLVTLVPSSENPFGIEIEFGVEYENGTSAGTSIPGLLDEVGAFQSGFDPLGAEEVLLFRARFTTQAVTLVDDFVGGLREDPGTVVLDVLSNDDLPIGTAGFVGDLADIRPWHDVVLFDPASVPPDDAIQLLGTSLQIATGDTVIEGVGEASAGGSVVIAPNGRQLLYTPAPDFFGTETFSYMIAGEEAEVTVVVEPINDAPAGVDDIYGSRFDETLVVTPEQGLLANDRDAEGDALSLTLLQTPTSGTLELQSDGSFVYLPAPGFRGRDTFSYFVADSTGLESGETTVRIDVGMPQMSVRLELDDTPPEYDYSLDDASGELRTVYLRAWVQDLRDEYYLERGVAAAYLDVLYDADVLQPILDSSSPLGFEIEFGPAFDNTGSGDASQPGLLDEIGSFTLAQQPLGARELLLFKMPMQLRRPLLSDDSYQVSINGKLNRLKVLENDRDLMTTTHVVAELADVAPEHDAMLQYPATGVNADQMVLVGGQMTLTAQATLQLASVGESAAGGTVTIGGDGDYVLYAPPVDFVGIDQFSYTAVDPDGQTAEATVVVEVVASWQNVHHPPDVNGDRYVSPIDALIVIHQLNQNGSGVLEATPVGPPFIDVSGDGRLSPIDALMVISYLSSGTLTSSASAIASTTSVAEAEAVNAQASMLPRADAGSELMYSALPGKSVSLLESTSPALSAAAATSHAAALPEPLPPAGVDEVYRRLDDLSADAARPSHELLDDPLVTATDLSAS